VNTCSVWELQSYLVPCGAQTDHCELRGRGHGVTVTATGSRNKWNYNRCRRNPLLADTNAISERTVPLCTASGTSELTALHTHRHCTNVLHFLISTGSKLSDTALVVPSQTSPRGAFVGQSGTGTGFSSTSSVCAC
jgi:hypothetical protein